MIDSLYIALKYIAFNRIKTATLVACITLISFLPVALELLLSESEKQLMSRAVSTPLVVGAKGSALDLVMNTLYFDDEVPELITMEASNRVMDTELALPIPLYVRFHARGNPILNKITSNLNKAEIQFDCPQVVRLGLKYGATANLQYRF